MTERLEETTLFVAATRPALVPIISLPLDLSVGLLMTGALSVVVTHNPFYFGVVVPLWFAAQLLVRYDYNAIRVVGLWLKTKGRSVDAWLWGGASPAPFPIKPDKHARGIP